MLVIPEGASPVGCIAGLDPGTDTLGSGFLQVDVRDWSIIQSTAFTFHGSKLAKDSWYTGVHGNRAGRIAAHEDNLVQQFQYFQPFTVASESPFLGSFPQTFAALTETVSAIRTALWRYDPWQQLWLFDPPSVKMAVGAASRSKAATSKERKEEVKVALMALPDLNYTGPTPIEQLDEHSVDALAVAYCRLRVLREQQT